MRLINIETNKIEEFVGNDVPKYAILSHTWGAEEVSYQCFFDPNARTTDGYAKIGATCDMALRFGLRYVWVDSCCIDKSSSSEFSEAINSMFRWYEESEVCFAFLVDVPPQKDAINISFKASRWFTRGWTLQELLAPQRLEFFDADWKSLGTRHELSTILSHVTGINESFLVDNIASSRHNLLQKASIAERMSWAGKRITTRKEDVAYCLLGIFGVNMPLIYGEGMSAFLRLQEEIIRHSFDPSLLAWNAIRDGNLLAIEGPVLYSPWRSTFGLLARKEHPWAMPREQDEYLDSGMCSLAPSPRNFLNCEDIVVRDASLRWSATSQGLEITLPMSENIAPYLLIPCYMRDDPSNLLALPLLKQKDDTYLRACAPLELVSHHKWYQWGRKTSLITTKARLPLDNCSRCMEEYDIWIHSIPSCFCITKIYSNGNLTPLGNLRKIPPNRGPLMRNNSGVAGLLFTVDGQDTILALRFQQSPDMFSQFF
ncbi:heterokaryon incompatibility protein-domain-containing protein [Xylariaceae sp. AK1471]|nr:heterokaryon incompatibility protein-domain-containing protein [Xylariaceae sp. AK1471]